MGSVSDMPMVSGDGSREDKEIGVMRKSLESELILSARDIIPLDEVLEANDFESEGLYTEKGVVPMIEVDDKLLDKVEEGLNELLNEESRLLDLGGSGRMFDSLL